MVDVKTDTYDKYVLGNMARVIVKKNIEIDYLKDVNAALLSALSRMVRDCPPSTDIPIIWDNIGALRQAREAISLAEEGQE